MKTATISLEETSALVLLWLQDGFYRQPGARAFIEKLDLSAGRALHKACNAVWPDYDAVINNRKTGIRQLALRHQRKQIILPGAGLDAMGLELAESLPDCHIYELDRAYMADKQQLIDCRNISFIEADIGESLAMRAALQRAGWRADRSSLLVLEGISYYLTPEQLKRLVVMLRPDCVLAEYLLPDSVLDSASRDIAKGVFTAIMGARGYAGLSRYTAQGLAVLLDMALADQWSMHRLEAMRLAAFPAQKACFHDSGFGWIEMAVFKPVDQAAARQAAQ